MMTISAYDELIQIAERGGVDGTDFRVWLDGREVTNWCTAFEFGAGRNKGRVRLYHTVDEDRRIWPPRTQSWHDGNVTVARFS